MVNLRPIVQGHVLVIPFRVVPKLKDLSNEENTDLWLCFRKVQDMLEKHYFLTRIISADDDNNNNHSRSFGFNVAVQDGIAAGQSVGHVHMYIHRMIDEYRINK